jgi:hypothetical protein
MVMINGGHEKKPRGIISVTQVTNRPCGVEGHHVSRAMSAQVEAAAKQIAGQSLYHKHGISARP